MNIKLPETPELIQQENGYWRIKLPPIYVAGVRTEVWLSGEKLIDSEWVFVNEQTAYKAAHDWWLEKLSRQFKPVVTRQPVAEAPWWVAEGKSDYKFKFD